jgi:hypothetical protein
MGRIGTGVVEVSDSSYEISFAYKGVRCEPACARLRRSL